MIILRAALFALMLLSFAPMTHAQEPEEPAAPQSPLPNDEAAETKESIYSPEMCEFSVTFPEEPFNAQECDGGKCYEVSSFTEVFDMSATVNYRVVCNPLSEGVYEQFSPEIMAKTLQARGLEGLTKVINSTFTEDEDKRYKQAAIVGEGLVGRSQTIYIAQMWLGHKSAMTVEAELIGEENDEADALYAEILKSIHYTGLKEKAD